MNCPQQTVDVFHRWYLARVTLTIYKNDNLWYLGNGFAGPVHSIDVLKGDDGIHRQATVKDLAHGKRRFQLQLIPPKGPSSNQTLAPLTHSESSLIQNETYLVKSPDYSWPLYCKDWICITKGAHSWYQILYSFIDFILTRTDTANLQSRGSLKSFTGLQGPGPWA